MIKDSKSLRTTLILALLILTMVPNNCNALNDDWTIGVGLGDYLVTQIQYNSITRTPVGMNITFQIVQITDTNIYYTETRSPPNSNEGAFLDYLHNQVKSGHYLFSTSSKAHGFTTTNIEYIKDYLKDNTSTNLTFEENNTHFFVHDYFLMGAHSGVDDHYHDYNTTYNKSTGWLEFVEVSHVTKEGDFWGIIRIKAIESGCKALPKTIPSPFTPPGYSPEETDVCISVDEGFLDTPNLYYGLIFVVVINFKRKRLKSN